MVIICWLVTGGIVPILWIDLPVVTLFVVSLAGTSLTCLRVDLFCFYLLFV